jgi:CspA family cold shock protein
LVVAVPTGRIIQFNQIRGYGFIAPDGGGEDVFIHSEELKGHARGVQAGTRVQFDVVDGARGQKAYDVTVLGGVSSRLADDELSDVISAVEYGGEVTDALITFCPDIRAAQIVEIRDRLTASARRRGWIED